MTTPSHAPILELRRVGKTYPGVRAVDGVDFDLRPGEVHGVVGENGAGKSTLIRIIRGVVQPDEGKLLVDVRRFGEARSLDSIGAAELRAWLLELRSTLSPESVAGYGLGLKAFGNASRRSARLRVATFARGAMSRAIEPSTDAVRRSAASRRSRVAWSCPCTEFDE